MEELREIIAKNISDLRKKSGLTQIELAEKLNYSDKAVSKWERGDSVPDVGVLKQIADLFDVSVDYLLTADHSVFHLKPDKVLKNNHLVISLLSMMIVWTVATIIFVVLGMTLESLNRIWIVYVYAVPVSAIVLIVFNSMWGNHKLNFLFVSILVWGVLLALYLTLLFFNVVTHLWLVLILGVPAQIIILLWSRLKFRHSHK